MEDWMAFVETFSLYLLHDLPWEDDEGEIRDLFEEMWGLLRPACLYFMRYDDGQHTEPRILSAQALLLQYGRLVERVRVHLTVFCLCLDMYSAYRPV